MNVLVAYDPAYDHHGRRYPPGWASMADVILDETAAEAAGIDVLQLGRARASPKNLATWASKLYDASARRVSGVDLSAAAARASSDELAASMSAEQLSERLAASGYTRSWPEDSVDCIVCGSRGGQVTLPALWRLGCRRPAVVLNGGCARAELAWAWPVGVPVVLLAGGADFFNEHRDAWEGGDARYLQELWAAVPPANQPTTAIVFVPGMGHQQPLDTLAALLPACVAYAASHLARPLTAEALGGVGCTVVTRDCAPQGVWIR